MKKLILGLCLLFPGLYATAQNGLDSVYAEKYYVSNAADAAGAGVGTLPVGSVTWRIYACLQPGYKVQAVYGVPGHDLIFKTTTTFYNNPGGASVPNFTKPQLAANSTMLDSWLTMGAASAGSGINKNFGVLKSEDDGVANVVNSNVPPILQNNTGAGIPLTTQDGLLIGTLANPAQSISFVGLSNGVPNELDVFEDGSANGNLFTTANGSWAVLSTGAPGPLPSNRVLIAQITTDGVFNYALNIQIGTPTPGISQNFVASNPVAGEITIPSLIDTLNQPNVPSVVSITNPINGASFNTGDPVTIDASATDVDGVASVAFFVNGLLVFTDPGFPYQYIWPSTVGTKILTVVATDGLGAQTTSAPVTITVGNNTPPIVQITSPVNGFATTYPAPVTINATASDPGGSVTSVEFFVNAVSIGTIASPGPYTIVWPSVIGPAILTARATDNGSAQTTSAPVSIDILDPNALPYKVTEITTTCVPSTFCLPITAVDSVNDVTGYDVVLHYDKTRVYPTGSITVSNDMINPMFTTSANSIDTTNGLMNISVYFNVTAPPTAEFFGKGDVFCVQFAKLATFGFTDTALFSVSTLQESYPNHVENKFVDPGKFITYRDSVYNGSLLFWFDNSPIQYDQLNPSAHLITNIFGSNALCVHTSAPPVQPDLNGNFVYNTFNSPTIDIEKDIAPSTDVQPVINGFDAYLTRLVLINDASFVPSVFQMIAMDVNTDGVVSAGDLSQINQRAVLMIYEFKQDWNYDASGNQIPGSGASKDWLFIDGHTLSTNVGYLISSIYPFNDNVGYSKARVPQVPFCHALQILNYAACPEITADYYSAVLLGDANGNFSTTDPNSAFKMSDNKIIFDLSKAAIINGFIDIPVSVASTTNVNALDFSLMFNESNLTFHSVIDNTNHMEALVNFNTADKTLRFTSSSLQNYDISKAPVSVRFAVSGASVSASDLNSLQGFINGDRARVEVTTTGIAGVEAEVNVYPNPASDVLNVVAGENATMQVLGLDGKLILFQSDITADQKFEINTSHFTNGVYMVKIYNENFITVKKVVINK